jgi:hypothetical protein
MSGALAIAILVSTTNEFLAGAAERDLVLHGTQIDAVVYQIEAVTDPQRAFDRRQKKLPVNVRFTLPGDAESRTSSGELPIKTTGDTQIHPGDHLLLHMDPSDPDHWTDRQEPENIASQMWVALSLLPLLAILLLVTWLQRARVLRIWRLGEIAEATVHDVRQTALAPLSRQVRFSLTDGSSTRLCSVLIPNGSGVPQRGDAIELIMPKGVPQRAILGRLYV